MSSHYLEYWLKIGIIPLNFDGVISRVIFLF